MVDLPQPDSPTTPSVSPALTSKSDAVDGADRADLTLQQALPDRELLLQPGHLQQVVARGGVLPLVAIEGLNARFAWAFDLHELDELRQVVT